MDRRINNQRWNRRRLAWGVGVVLALALIGWVIMTSQHGNRLRVDASHLMVSTVEAGEFQEFIPVSGSVIPVRTHFLDAAEGGRVEVVYRTAGSFVTVGDPILKLANTNLLLDIMYREAELYEQSNNLRNTQITMEQNRLRMQRELLELDHDINKQQRVAEYCTELVKNDLVARQEWEEAQEELDYLRERRTLTLAAQQQDSLFRTEQVRQLVISLERMEANLTLVRQNLDNLVLKAPVTGQLTALYAETGQSKARGERLGQVDVLDGFKVRAAVDQHYINRIGPEQPGSLAFEDRTYSLQIERVYPEVVQGRFEVDLRFADEEPPGLRRGQTLHLRLILGDRSEALLLGAGSFYQTTGGRWAFVVDPSGAQASRREIVLGRRNSQHYEVLSGLRPGEQVIVSTYEQFGAAECLLMR